jgi:hypothetical protein
MFYLAIYTMTLILLLRGFPKGSYMGISSVRMNLDQLFLKLSQVLKRYP